MGGPGPNLRQRGRDGVASHPHSVGGWHSGHLLHPWPYLAPRSVWLPQEKPSGLWGQSLCWWPLLVGFHVSSGLVGVSHLKSLQ